MNLFGLYVDTWKARRAPRLSTHLAFYQVSCALTARTALSTRSNGEIPYSGIAIGAHTVWQFSFFHISPPHTVRVFRGELLK